MASKRNKTAHNIRTLLILAPFHLQGIPPAGLASLKSFLMHHGFTVDCLNIAMLLADVIGREANAFFIKNLWASNILYSRLLFPSTISHSSVEMHYRKIAPDHLTGMRTMLRLIRQVDAKIHKAFKLSSYDVIGFSASMLTQFVPTLYYSKSLKSLYPHARVVLGGELCVGEMGKSLLDAFSWIDGVFHGEGEHALRDYLQMLEGGEARSVKGCSWRDGKRIFSSPYRSPIKDLDSLPTPDYSDYFNLRKQCGNLTDLQGVPIEMSRGCWWGRCTFCTDYCKSRLYRRRTPNAIAHMLGELIDRHNMNAFYCTDSAQYQPTSQIVQILHRSDRKLHFFQELRATFTETELQSLSEVGVRECQIGIESLCSSLLKKMDKGTTAIQNIYALKLIKKHGIRDQFNLITMYPGETKKEFAKTIVTIKRCWHLVYNFSESPFTLEYGSRIYENPQQYGLRNVRPHRLYSNILPKEYLARLTCFLYEYDTSLPIQGSYRKALNDQCWKGSYHPTLVWEAVNESLVVEDGRVAQCLRVHRFVGHAKELYLYCDRVRAFDEIHKRFPELSYDEIMRTLRGFCLRNLMIKDGKHYLSLAIDKAFCRP